jgi:hypothetical protein
VSQEHVLAGVRAGGRADWRVLSSSRHYSEFESLPPSQINGTAQTSSESRSSGCFELPLPLSILGGVVGHVANSRVLNVFEEPVRFESRKVS